jgi:hypothetical protein
MENPNIEPNPQTIQQTEIQNTKKLLRLVEAGILDQARLRPLNTSLGSFIEGKITSTLIRLKVSGLA